MPPETARHLLGFDLGSTNVRLRSATSFPNSPVAEIREIVLPDALPDGAVPFTAVVNLEGDLISIGWDRRFRSRHEGSWTGDLLKAIEEEVAADAESFTNSRPRGAGVQTRSRDLQMGARVLQEILHRFEERFMGLRRASGWAVAAGCPLRWGDEERTAYTQFLKEVFPSVDISVVSETLAVIRAGLDADPSLMRFERQPVLVFDSGGNGSSCTVCRFSSVEGELRIAAERVSIPILIAGNDFDIALAEHVHRTAHEVPKSDEATTICLACKEKLCIQIAQNHPRPMVRRRFPTGGDHSDTVEFALDRRGFEIATQGLTRQLKEALTDGLRSLEGTRLSNPALVFMSGGNSRNFIVQKVLRDVLPLATIASGVDPGIAVSQGLALMASPLPPKLVTDPPPTAPVEAVAPPRQIPAAQPSDMPTRFNEPTPRKRTNETTAPFGQARLQLNSGPHSLEITVEGKVSIGRQSDNDFTLPPEDQSVSRHHAQITEIGKGIYEFEDLNSKFGSKVNGRPVTQAVRLKSGDRIKIGKHEIVFSIE